ncbi:hypothetical protein IMG5_076190 [Ichthyophthirius multifiliis]|uniref:Uncharacterized protein n=1 Tax=Ichthyophthirius multifiliis TaxID=5932 RepID=G0QQ88_ICHMU|nr:hypothetical protein IMG5_076190 [Ichthyophthirius multifiliis]EGR32589.1 hypothetical protein IMG5_076190 [Ichthyophthirius multifiliis]|eukprot:XP_004036575.1 hypothetical protein IMG5_076190 [Ichthyophthirius multifiliis]
MLQKNQLIKQKLEVQQIKEAEQLLRTDQDRTPKQDIPNIITYEPEDGIGKILTSQATVHGDKTKFTQQVKKGDFIILMHPQSLANEERKIACVMSDRSILLSQAFSSDIMSYTQYQIRKQDEIQQEEESIEHKYLQKFQILNKKISKDNNNSNKVKLEYRQKKGMWGYKNVVDEVSDNVTKEQLLDLRAKKNRDKFCWI